MNTDERLHTFCSNPDTVNNDLLLGDKQSLMQTPESSELIMDNDYYVNTHYYVQNKLNNEIKHNSINISTSYWNNVFESIKLVNSYWTKISNIGIDNSSVIFQKEHTILNLQ